MCCYLVGLMPTVRGQCMCMKGPAVLKSSTSCSRQPWHQHSYRPHHLFHWPLRDFLTMLSRHISTNTFASMWTISGKTPFVHYLVLSFQWRLPSVSHPHQTDLSQMARQMLRFQNLWKTDEVVAAVVVVVGEEAVVPSSVVIVYLQIRVGVRVGRRVADEASSDGWDCSRW